MFFAASSGLKLRKEDAKSEDSDDEQSPDDDTGEGDDGDFNKKSAEEAQQQVYKPRNA